MTPAEAPTPGTGECTFPSCDCPGEDPVCPDFETSNETIRLGRIYRGTLCPVHQVEEPCPTCSGLHRGGPVTPAEAAVQAMARALESTNDTSDNGYALGWWERSAKAAIAALAASPDVRAALVEVAHFGFDGQTLTSVVDAILAALDPGAA